MIFPDSLMRCHKIFLDFTFVIVCFVLEEEEKFNLIDCCANQLIPNDRLLT